MTNSSLPVQSPCVEVCALNDRDICVGCYRTADEIIEWFTANSDRKNEILAAVAERRTKK